MPVAVESWRVLALHFMYLAKSGWPQPNPVPKGYFTGIVPQVWRHVPLVGMAWSESVWEMRKRERKRERKGCENGSMVVLKDGFGVKMKSGKRKRFFSHE